MGIAIFAVIVVAIVVALFLRDKKKNGTTLELETQELLSKGSADLSTLKDDVVDDVEAADKAAVAEVKKIV